MNKSSVMKTRSTRTLIPSIRSWLFIAVALCLGMLLQRPALAASGPLTLTVVDGAGLPVTNFRWMLEEDNTSPGVPGTPKTDTISLIIHKSHAPVAATGTSATGVTIPDTGKPYLLSVLADGYSTGGLNVKAGQTTARVILNKHELPTAQISVLAFHDNNPVNNAPDATELGIPGCQVILHDFLGGPMLTDTFGNPLGTTYLFDNTGEPVMVDGAPVVDVLGSGQIYTDANGKALIKNLAMGKYGVQVIPPTGSDWTAGHGSTPNINGSWHQTATIEGTPTVDAWVKANEPMVFTEGFGVGTYHVFFGFVDPTKLQWAQTPPPSGGVTVKGTVRYNHFGRPPQTPYDVGPPMAEAWVALNDFATAGAPGAGLYAAACDPETGYFEIHNVPANLTYQLVVWDTPLDAIFSTFQIKVGAGETDLHDVLCQRWFGTYEGSVFYDDGGGDPNKAANGFRDPGEQGIPQQTLNIRWRDGTIYQSQVTDTAGDFSFTEVFPFFKWLIGEVDFARFKPTGLTAVVDEGGVIPPDNGWLMPSEGVRNPQPQFVLNSDGTQTTTPIPNLNTPDHNNLSRTELSTDPAAPLLLVAMHTFLNQNNRIDWGKINYGPGENGGIAGIVGYGATRAEVDPRMGTIDPWESGIPRVQMVLYQDANADKIIDDVNLDGHVTLADIDNYPLGFRDGELPGPEDVDRDGNGVFDTGDAIQIAWTDSWDDSPPTGSQQPNPPVVLGKPIIGNDNYSTWNQIRDGVFDGGYLFGSYYPEGIVSGNPQVDYLPAGMYIVQSCPPKGYLIQTEESFNVTTGDAYKPSKLLLPPELVGTPANHAGDNNLKNILPAVRQTLPNLYTVPQYLSLFPDQQIPCDFAGQERPIADMKWVRVAQGKNAAADFHVYTEVPKATRCVGFVLNDFTAEYDPASPLYGEKSPPGWIPVSFRDWAGHEVARTYSDEYGTYEALLPSSISAAIPMPSGFAPNMLTLTLNDPTMPDPANPGNRIPDPYYNPSFATTPWTLHYYPATFLYADTPILPAGAFVGGPNKTLDVEPTDDTPVIKEVTVGPVATPTVPGPYVPANSAPGGANSRIVNIDAQGATEVPNPNYVLGTTDPLTVTRHYGFGAHTPGDGGVVTINGVPIDEADIVNWSNLRIRVRVEAILAEGASGQLMVTRANGKTTPIGITLTRGSASDHFGAANSKIHVVTPADPDVEPMATRIQDAIDAAGNGDLVIVPASTWKYNENPIMWKPVRLQGAGVGTVLNANANPAERLTAWHARVALRLGGDPFTQDECSGILVLGTGNQFGNNESRIDGFQITGSISGGGIGVYDRADNLRISNNKIIGNVGSTAGGIRIGQQGLPGVLYDNPNVTITYNQVFKNAGELGAGGIGLYHGASGYKIVNNYIEGNVTRGNGAGIGHEGRNPGGLIANNVVAFNESFIDALGVGATLVVAADGGGIYIGGIAPAGGGLSEGSGSVTIINNLIQGNLAGVGHGGGIRAFGINGADVAANPGDPTQWYSLDILNNVIVNNVAGYSGGGISLQDAAQVRIINNTIAMNDCTSTAQAAFSNPGSGTSTAHGGGLVSHPHSAQLLAALPGGQPNYGDPELRNNIFFRNQSYTFSWSASSTLPAGSLSAPFNNDLAVEDGGGSLHPTYCILSPDTAGYGAAALHNQKINPGFVDQYNNTLSTAGVLDEGGNRVSVRQLQVGIFTPGGAPRGDYHVVGSPASPAIDAGDSVAAILELNADFDGNPRPTGTATDIGADEFLTAGSSIIPPGAPIITVPQNGPAALGEAPAITPLTGAGTPPGAPMAPLYLNPLPGDPLNPLLDPEMSVDSDGDGNPANDVDYYNLTAGDGWATMADGTDLYTFGFSDQTATVLAKTAEAAALGSLAEQEAVLRQVGPAVLTEGMLSANLSAPTMVFHEGRHAYLDLSNVGMLMRPDLFDSHSVHFHGFAQAASIFDGEPMASISIAMGGTLRYYYKIVEPGTYLYHCHVEATEHMQMGMIGNLYVLPRQNNLPDGTMLGSFVHHTGNKYAYNDGDGSTRYDVEAPLQVTGFDKNFHEQHIAVQPLPFAALADDYPLLNGRGYPDTIVPGDLPAPPANDYARVSQKVTSLVTAAKGKRILLRLSNVSETDIHTLTVLGVPMRVVAKDARLLRGPTGKSLAYNTTSVKLGGGETTDVILDTTNVNPGTYLLYATRLNHLSNNAQDYGGLMTQIVITAP